MKPGLGLAGRLAQAFIESKLTPLVIAASILIGAGAVMILPREEEPQIVVPMIDVFVSMPGATPKEVETRVTTPMEKLLWEIPGVEYIYYQGVTITGRVIGKVVPARHLARNAEKGVQLHRTAAADLQTTREGQLLGGGVEAAEFTMLSA